MRRLTMEAYMEIIAVGSVALDTIETPCARVENVWGGSAVYFAFAASFFSPPGIVGAAGEDFPEECLAAMKERGIGLEGLEIRPGKTFAWEGRYFANMNERETLSVCPNVFENYKPVLPESYRDAKFVFLGNISPELQIEVLSQVRKPELVAADTMDLWINNEKEALLELLARIDVLILNDSEARLLTGETNLLLSARAINGLGPDTVIIKRGESGALLVKSGEPAALTPAYPLSSFKDPTGAGDAFGGGFMGYLASAGKIDDEAFKTAAACGGVVASFCVEGFSLDSLASARREDIERRLETLRKLASF